MTSYVQRDCEFVDILPLLVNHQQIAFHPLLQFLQKLFRLENINQDIVCERCKTVTTLLLYVLYDSYLLVTTITVLTYNGWAYPQIGIAIPLRCIMLSLLGNLQSSGLIG